MIEIFKLRQYVLNDGNDVNSNKSLKFGFHSNDGKELKLSAMVGLVSTLMLFLYFLQVLWYKG